jgi:hypothetical protein
MEGRAFYPINPLELPRDRKNCRISLRTTDVAAGIEERGQLGRPMAAFAGSIPLMYLLVLWRGPYDQKPGLARS